VWGWFEESSEDGELPAEGELIGSDIAIGLGVYMIRLFAQGMIRMRILGKSFTVQKKVKKNCVLE